MQHSIRAHAIKKGWPTSTPKEGPIICIDSLQGRLYLCIHIPGGGAEELNELECHYLQKRSFIAIY